MYLVAEMLYSLARPHKLSLPDLPNPPVNPSHRQPEP